MKGKARKLSAVVLLLLMLSGVFAGCNGIQKNGAVSDNESGNVKGEQSTMTGSGDTELKEVTLRFYFPGDKKVAVDEVWQAISEKYKDKLNAKFEITHTPWNDYVDKLTVISASGDNYDMNFDANFFAYPKMVNKGAYLPLNDLLPNYAPKRYEAMKASGGLAAATAKGEIMCIPWAITMNQARKYAIWRGDLAEKAGMNVEKDSIKTIEDFDKMLYEAKKAYPEMNTITWEPYNVLFLEEIFLNRDEMYNIDFHRFVFDINDPDYKLIPIEQTQAFRDMAVLVRKWYQDGIIPKNLMVDKDTPSYFYKQGKTFAIINSHEWANNNNPFFDKSAKKNSSELYPEKKSVNRSPLANVMAVNRNAANPERSLMFIELAYTDKEMFDMVMYGIEGKTYKLDGNMAVVADGVDPSNSNYLDWLGRWAFWNPQFLRPTSQYPEGFWQKEEEIAKQPINLQNPLDSLFFDTTSIKNEIAKRDQINSEVAKLLQYGVAEDVDKAINELVEKQKQAGLDKVLSELQRQVDEFLAGQKQ